MVSKPKSRLGKSGLFGVNIEDRLLATASQLNFKAESLPFVYLGLSEDIQERCHFGGQLLKKIQKKLDRWKIFNLSQGGRLTLNKTVLSNLPIYYVLFCYAYEGN